VIADWVMNDFDYEAHVITLDPSSPRFRQFQQNNQHLQCSVFTGVRGADLSLAERIYQGLMTPQAIAARLATDGEIGCAASHKRLWEKAAASANGLLILEDDAATHPDLVSYIAKNFDQISQSDLCLFAINTDSIFEVEQPSGLRQSCVLKPKYPDYDWIKNALAMTDWRFVQSWKLISGFGLCCYFITPHGAQRLLDLVFPLTEQKTHLPAFNLTIPGISVDKRLNAFYPGMDARVSIPFLAFSPNTNSTTR